MNKFPIYLDYMATTPIDPRVVEKMLTCMRIEGHFGNPSSTQHIYGQHAEREVAFAREVIAQVIGGEPSGIVFTSGATESINLALKGAASFYQRQGKHIITTQIEHKAVLDTCHYLSRQGFAVTYLPVESNGLINLETLKNALQEDTILVSIAHVNNEIGVIQDIQAIGEQLRARGILFHVDAAQSVGKVKVDIESMNIDLLSLSAHKAYGPKGVGGLYVRQRPKIHLTPLIHGGKQQNGIRSGTLPTHQIIGMAEAFRIAHLAMDSENIHLLNLRNRLWEGLRKISGIRINGDFFNCVPNNLHLNFYDMKKSLDQNLLEKFPEALFKYLAVSTASACLSSNNEPSYVLKAIGLSDEEIAYSFRLSMGRFTIEEEINQVVNTIHHIVT